jgi:hypothetical protein
MPPAGLPRDPAQWLALALAIAAILAARPLSRAFARPRLLVAICAIAASALSAAYIAVYLRGGPRIIDATSYFLEARALSQGSLSFPLAEPEHAVLGRFLVRSEHAGAPHASVLFPPGYPAILAIGFLLRAPMIVGPLLAAALVLVTFDLARRALGDAIAPLAALLSVVCASLRYHTADTMSHGLAALCFALTLALLLRAADAPAPRRALLLAMGGGIAAGWLFATRPISALALAPVLVYLLLRDERARASAPRLALSLAIGAIPGLVLFFAHQRAATGAWLLSSQRLYYAVSDGPPDCFRYGFGAGVGCLGEHGDFVRARLADGYGCLAAAGTTLRRLKLHLVDPANLEPLALLVVAGAFLARATTRGRALGIAVIAQILAYVPFYFDGNYPGGGARFFCDVLPIEHALLALAVVTIASRRRAPERWIAAAVALALAGFAFRAGFDHALLRDREGGRPMFDPADLARAGVTRGLVFVDTDHGFDLAFDPDPAAPITIARHHGDALDRLTWIARGRPPAYRHRFAFPSGAVTIDPLSFPPLEQDAALVIEGESLWPALSQRGGYALPAWAAGTCASHDRWLAIAGPSASITLDLPARLLRGRAISLRIAARGAAGGTVELVADGASLTRFTVDAPRSEAPICRDLPPIAIPWGLKHLTLIVDRPGAEERGLDGLFALDAIAVTGGEID